MLDVRGENICLITFFSDMSKHTIQPHGKISQSPTKAKKKKRLETFIDRIHLVHNEHKGNSTKDDLDSTKQEILENDLNIEGIKELLDFLEILTVSQEQ